MANRESMLRVKKSSLREEFSSCLIRRNLSKENSNSSYTIQYKV